MATINRYTQSPVALVNPMSMEELAFAPSLLRQKHDATAQQLSDLGISSGEYDVLNNYQSLAGDLTNPLKQNIDKLALELSQKGITASRGVPEAMKLKSQYSNLFGQNGTIGQLETATKQYRTRAEELKKQYEDNPLLQSYALSQLKPGEAVMNNGKLNLGNMTDAKMVRHIAEEDILDRLNNAAKDIKPSDLSRTGIQYNGKIGSFNDLYSIAHTQGVSFDEVDALVKSMLSGEEELSLVQFAKATGQDPAKAMKNFRAKMTNIATVNTTSNTTYRDFNVEDKLAVDRLKSMQSKSTLTTSPGPSITRDMSDTLKDAGLSFDESGENITETVTGAQDWDAALSGEKGFFWDMVGNAFGYNTIKNAIGGVIDIASNPKLAMAILTGNATIIGTAWAKVDNKKSIVKGIDKAVKSAIKEDMTKSVASFKESYPEMVNKSNKEAYEIITQSRANFSQLYSDVVAPQDADFAYINKQVLGSENSTGDFERRQIFVGDQKIGTGSEFFKQLGYSSFAEFKEKGQPQMETGVTFGAKQPAAFVMNVLDSDGNSVTATVESNKEFAAAGRVPNKMLDYLNKGKFFREMDNTTSIQDFAMDADEGNSIYYVYDVQRSLPMLVEAPKGMSPKAVKEYLKTAPDNEITFADAVNKATESIFYKSPVGNLLSK